MHQMRRTTAQALEGMRELLLSIDHGQRDGIGHADRLGLMRQARTLAGQVQGLAGVLTAEVERHQSSVIAEHTPLTSLIAVDEKRDDKDAAASIFEARDVARHGHVSQAVLNGEVSINHARGIAQGMRQLPGSLDAKQREAAQDAFLRHASSSTPRELAAKAPSVLAEVAPEMLPDPDDRARALEEQRRRAIRNRSFRHGDDGDGSTWFSGSLPHVDAQPLLTLINSYVELERRAARERAAGLRETRPGPGTLREHLQDITPAQRRADALVRLIRDHRGAPAVSGDRPRIVVTVTEADLRERATTAGALADGAPITPGELRRLCCDADLLPVVLGSDSEILDVGRTQRLVTPAIRRALTLRDGGCAFPRCTAPAAECEAHHVIPWWDGGSTSLGNLALLCHHHHGVVEPNRLNTGAHRTPRWSITFHVRTRSPVVHPPRPVSAGFQRPRRRQ